MILSHCTFIGCPVNEVVDDRASNRKSFDEIFNALNMLFPALKGLLHCGNDIKELEGREDDGVDDH